VKNEKGFNNYKEKQNKISIYFENRWRELLRWELVFAGTGSNEDQGRIALSIGRLKVHSGLN